ncbi:MAG: hypothetical protein AMS18_08500 [Gemmatimonas sp. SG8_17]|nr:MAG: hypothetical protein AMS18_08500 [Gemmatimonas sp. SG8_17]
MHNIFQYLPAGRTDELTEDLVSRDAFRIERIVSHGNSSTPGFWYDQAEDEWVIVLAGSARLRFEAGAESVELGPGDYLNIPAHVRHRVDWTDPECDTVWLAVFYR